jgi:hypothetical protein
MRKALYLAAALLAVPHAASAQFAVIKAPDIIFAESEAYFSVTGQNTKCQFIIVSVEPPEATFQNALYVVNEQIGITFDFDLGGGAKSYPRQFTVTIQGTGTIDGEPAPYCANYKNILKTMVTVRAPFSGTIKPRPVIQALMPFSNVTPGGIVALKGSFGATKGQLLMRLPNGARSVVPTPSQWSATLIVGTLDSTIQGQLPGSVAFRVVDAAGVTSEWFTANKGSPSIQFRPTIAEVVLDPSSVTVNHCSDDAGDNKCNASTSSHENVWSDLADVTIPHPPAGLDTKGTAPAGPSIDCHHASDWGLSSDDDTDTYSVSLKNGWTIEHLDVSTVVMDNGEVDVVQTIPDGATSGQLVVHYHIGSSGGTVVYGAFIVVRGPKGVAF